MDNDLKNCSIRLYHLPNLATNTFYFMITCTKDMEQGVAHIQFMGR